MKARYTMMTWPRVATNVDHFLVHVQTLVCSHDERGARSKLQADISGVMRSLKTRRPTRLELPRPPRSATLVLERAHRQLEIVRCSHAQCFRTERDERSE